MDHNWLWAILWFGPCPPPPHAPHSWKNLSPNKLRSWKYVLIRLLGRSPLPAPSSHCSLTVGKKGMTSFITSKEPQLTVQVVPLRHTYLCNHVFWPISTLLNVADSNPCKKITSENINLKRRSSGSYMEGTLPLVQMKGSSYPFNKYSNMHVFKLFESFNTFLTPFTSMLWHPEKDFQLCPWLTINPLCSRSPIPESDIMIVCHRPCPLKSIHSNFWKMQLALM